MIRRLAILQLGLLLLLSSSAGAQTQLGRTWTCALVNLAATLTECQSVGLLAAGERYVITDIVVQTTTATAGTYSIQSGTGTNCGTNTAALFPAGSTASRFTAPINSAMSADIVFRPPVIGAADSAVCVIGTATNTINIQLIGFITR